MSKNMALIRLKSEWYKMKQDPPPLCFAEPTSNDFFQWNAMIVGPPGSPYVGTALFAKMIFREYYFKPPKIYFVQQIYHPNVDEYGNICMDILSTSWSPALTISKILICISSILSNPLFDETPFNLDAANMYESDRETYNKIAKNSCHNQFFVPEFQSLYLRYNFWQSGTSTKKLLQYDIERKDATLEDLCYPHDKIDKIFNIFEKDAFTFIPFKVVEAYERAKELYPLIKAAKGCTMQMWVKEMLKTGDNDFVENNIEFRISENLHQKEMWNFYFQYLRKHNNTKKLLQMYSYYCRFFPDEIHTMKDYAKAATEFGPSVVAWKNAFKFEIFDENVILTSARTNTPIMDLEEQMYTKPVSCYFTSSNAISQDFSFKPPMMNYILQNWIQQASPEMFQKLHQTCKYFFIQRPTPICYKFEIMTEIKTFVMEKHSARNSDEFFQSPSFQNIHLSTVLSVMKCDDPLRLSAWLPRFCKCDAKYIFITSQHLTETDFMLLIGSKRVIEVELEDTQIFDENGNLIMLEEILKLTPKIKRLRIDHVGCNPQTSEIISELPFENKIELFQLSNLSNQLDPYKFAEFITKNATSKIDIFLRFAPNVNMIYRKNFGETVKTHFETQWLKALTPNISIL